MSTRYTARLACGTTPAIALRLDLTARVQRRSQAEIVTEALGEKLPALDELSEQIKESGNEHAG